MFRSCRPTWHLRTDRVNTSILSEKITGLYSEQQIAVEQELLMVDLYLYIHQSLLSCTNITAIWARLRSQRSGSGVQQMK